jgi:tetratricopeptide (TPR) repeat protein
MKPGLLIVLLLGAGVALAQNQGSIVPPLPQPNPPKAQPAPPANAARIVPLSESIPDWQARWELARALSYLQRYDESLAEYKKVLAERPDDPAVRQDYGQVLLWAGKLEESFAQLNQIPADKLSAAGALALADTLVARRDYDRAEKLYRAQLTREPADQLTRLKLANILSWTKRYDESLALFRTLIAALPDDVQVRRRYALVLLWAGKAEESAAELKRTLTP